MTELAARGFWATEHGIAGTMHGVGLAARRRL